MNNPRPGLTKFNLDSDDIAPPTSAQRAKAKVEADRIGFTADTPIVAPPPRPQRISNFDTNFHIRTTANDRARFDDFAWQHRITKGEAMTRILDLALAAEKLRKDGVR
jgi:hypothetical protein